MTLEAIASEVERSLAEFYAFAPLSPAAAHLVTRAELVRSFGQAVAALPEYRGRAGVYLSESGDGAAREIHIGIHLDDAIRAKLEERDPTAALTDANLDEYCILIEEVSHFHLLLNRAQRDQGVSKLELEWQGEIDKLLICAMTLKRQAGDLHVLPLARKLYDQAIITAEDQELYWQATRHAARFWFAALRRENLFGPEFRRILRDSYDTSWATKLEHLAGFCYPTAA